MGKKRLLITGDFMRYYILIILCLIFELTACTAVQTENKIEYRNVDDSTSWDSYYFEEVTVLTEPTGAQVFYQNEYLGTSPITFKTRLLKFKVNQSGTNKEPMAWITGGYKVEVFKQGYLPNKATIYIKANDQTFKEAFRNVKSPAKHGPQTSYTGKRKLIISLTPSPASSK